MTLRVAYLTSVYPLASHVFIEREIEGLRKLGVDVRTFSVRHTPPGGLLSTQMRHEAEETEVLLESRSALLRSAARLLAGHPAAVRHSLARALRTGEVSARGRLWQAFYFVEAMRLYDAMVDQDLRHLHVHFANNAADIARLVVALGRSVEGPDSTWRWSMTMHGPTEFEAVDRFDLAAKVASADGVACISDFTRSQLMRLVDPAVWPRLQVVRMSVDTTRFTPIDREGRTGALKVLNVGRLVPEKGSPVLLDALAELRLRGVPFEVRIIGAGPLDSLLRERVTAAGLDDAVSLLGAVGQEELPAQYQWADAFCLPSLQEGLPVVLMEAMAAGLPVVTTTIAGIPELVVDGVNGQLVAPGRADLLADALVVLGADVRRRTTWGSQGRSTVERQFATDVVAPAQLSFLQSVQSAL